MSHLRTPFTVIGATSIVTACAGAYSGQATDASAPDGDALLAPTDAMGDTTATDTSDAKSDTPTLLFSDDFERPSRSLVPPWTKARTQQDGSLAVGLPDGGTSLGLTALSPTPEAIAYLVYDFAGSPARHAEASFSVKVVDIFPKDSIAGDAILFALSLETALTDASPGPEHAFRVGIRRQSARTFSLFVASKYDPGRSRTNYSMSTFDVGTRYTIRLVVDTTNRQSGRPLATGYVNGAAAVTLDGTDERVLDYTDTGKIYFPGGVEGAGYHLEMDDLKVFAMR
jgi:hypothetical protein